MHGLRSFWNDEAGSVVSAELVTIGTVVAVGAVTGMQTVSTAVNDEMKDVTKAMRSLNQSNSYRGFRGCNSMTAGSAFVDTSIDVMGDGPSNPPAGNQPRPSAESSMAVPDAEQFDSELADELESRELEANGPVTSADEKLGN